MPQTIAEEETWQEKGIRKFKENPFIPLGLFLTCFALGGAVRQQRKGNSHSLNRWLRARVVAQGATVAAMFIGSMYYHGGRQSTAQEKIKAKEAIVEEERRAFQMRMKEAEEAHVKQEQHGSNETGLLGQIWRTNLKQREGPKVSTEKPVEPTTTPPHPTPPGSKGQSLLSKFWSSRS